MNHLYGQGFWGSVDENGKELSKDLSLFLFKKELYRELKLPYIAEERIYSPPLIMMIISSI
jgi:hypothetical protein